MNTRSYGTGPSPGEYGADYENQLAQEDTLIERHLDDALDEGFRRPSVCGDVAPSARLKAWIRCFLRTSRTRHRESTFRSTKTSSNAPTKPRVKPNFPSEMRSEAREQVVAPDWGYGEDEEAELVADDVGISGGAASAEEAAVHIIDDEA
jgi:hypothetical protein